MAKAKKLPSGSWRCLAFDHVETVYKDGKLQKIRRYKSFTAPTKKEAEFLAAQYAVSGKTRTSEERKIFKDALEEYFELKSNVLSPSTLRGYDIMKRTAFPLLLSCTLGDLASTDIVQRQININAKHYAPKTLKNQFGLISAVMAANRLKIEVPTFPVSEKNSIKVPTLDEIKKILQILPQKPEIECQVLLALTCSLRQSEIAALTPANIEDDIIHVRGSRVKNEKNELVFKKTNKTKNSMRDIKAPAYLSRKLHELIEAKDPNEYIFSLSPNGLLSAFKRLQIENDMYPFSLHAMRHAFAALCLSSGVPDLYIMEMGGWSSDYVMKHVYQYTFADKAAEAKENINSFFDSNLDNNATRNATRK